MRQFVVSLLPNCIVLLGYSHSVTCYKKVWLVIMNPFETSTMITQVYYRLSMLVNTMSAGITLAPSNGVADIV